MSEYRQEGIFAQRTVAVDEAYLKIHRNQGGYELLGRTKDLLRTREQQRQALAHKQLTPR